MLVDGATSGGRDLFGDLLHELAQRWYSGHGESGAGDGDVHVEVGDRAMRLGGKGSFVLLYPFG